MPSQVRIEHDPNCQIYRLQDTRRAKLTQFGAWMQERDELVRSAAALGISKTEIAERTGLARSTIYRILDA